MLALTVGMISCVFAVTRAAMCLFPYVDGHSLVQVHLPVPECRTCGYVAGDAGDAHSSFMNLLLSLYLGGYRNQHVHRSIVGSIDRCNAPQTNSRLPLHSSARFLISPFIIRAPFSYYSVLIKCYYSGA